MRKNFPVLNEEYKFPPNATLVSTTDLKGIITYCNPTFVEMSGFTKEELISSPHNLVRHPDMPEEAFRDMWETVKNGNPWSALVKNRRKTGEYYWVVANVTPLMENGKPIGYMSVRTEPTRDQIEKAENLYQMMREEKSKEKLIHVFKNGKLVKNTILGKLKEKFYLTSERQLFLSIFIPSVIAWFIGHIENSIIKHFSFLILLSFAGLGYFYVKNALINPLRDALNFANKLAAGDLKNKIKLKSRNIVRDLEISLNQLNVNLLAIIRDAKNESMQVNFAAEEIAEGNYSLSERTENSASSLQQTAASMEEIHHTVKNNNDMAIKAQDLSTSAHKVVQESVEFTKQINETMDDIQKSGIKINEIISIINGISFQTNILALNAAIEAARAGNHGKGFAVVADEVRSLAQKTNNASKEISNLINISNKKIEDGYQKTKNSEKVILSALNKVNEVNELVQNISNASQQQLIAISQVNQAVSELDNITQQNAAMVEEISAASLSLKDQADILNSTVDLFKIER